MSRKKPTCTRRRPVERLSRVKHSLDEPLRADSGFFLGMLHGGVLTPDGTLRPDTGTLVIIHTRDFREGYARGRHDYFTQGEEIAHTEDDLLDLLKAHAQDNLYLGREQGTLRWAMGCTVGERSGRLLPLTEHEHPASQVKRMTILREA